MKTKRSLLAAASCLVLGLATAGSALAEKVTFGVLTDMSGTFSDLSGAGSVEAARLAIEDFGGSVLGEKIELVSADHQHKPEVGLNIARQWLDRDGVDVILDVPNSGIALAVANLVYVVLLFLGGVVVPIDDMPGALQVVSRALPAGALADITHGALSGDSTPGAAWLTLALWAVAAPAVAAHLFRWE